MQIRAFPPHYQLVYANFDIFSFSLISYASTRNGLLQYLQWITPVLAVDYSSTRNRLRRYSCVNRRKSPFKKEAYTAKSKKYNDGRITG